MIVYKKKLQIAVQVLTLALMATGRASGMDIQQIRTKILAAKNSDDNDEITRDKSLSTLSSSGSFTDDDELSKDESLSTINRDNSPQIPSPYQLLQKIQAFGDAQERKNHFPHSQDTYYSTLVKPSMITISKTGRYATYTASEYENYTYLLDLSTFNKKHPLPNLPNHESKWNSFEDLWFSSDETILHARHAHGAEYQWSTKDRKLLQLRPDIKRLLVTPKNTEPEFFITPYTEEDTQKYRKHYYYLRDSNAKITAEFYSTGKTCKILYSPTCKKIITITSYGNDYKLKIINIKGYTEYETQLDNHYINMSLALNGHYLVFFPAPASDRTGHLQLRDLCTGVTHALNIKIPGWPQPSFKSHNNILFLWPYFRNIAVFTLDTQAATQAGELSQHDCHISDIALSDNGFLIATAGSDNKIILYKKIELTTPEEKPKDTHSQNVPRATPTTNKSINKPTSSEKGTPVQSKKAKTIPVPPEIMKNIKGLMKAIDQRY